MAFLRDITARLGLQLDKGSFIQAERSISGLTSQLGQLGSLVLGSGAVLALGKIVELGSDANETLNVLNQSFGENSQAVQNWASEFGSAAGRSEFELREMAGTLGAVLNPLLKGNTEEASKMARGFSELAVDLGSFFNAADTDVLEALRSGLTGEAEPLKRFGVVMQDATLEAFRLEQGITKSYKKMSIAEKTALRYNFILEQTAAAQGDAIRTSEGWANASKGLASALKDLGTRLGLAIIPFAERVAIAIRNAVRGFLEWQRGTNFLKAALIVLGVIGAKVALGLLIAWAPVLMPILGFIAAVAIGALVLDDFLTFMEGGDSVIGRFIDSLFGPGSAQEAVKMLHEAWDGMVLFWNAEAVPAIKEIGSFLVDTAGEAGKAWDSFFSSFGDWVLENQKALLSFSDTVLDLLKDVGAFLGLDTHAEDRRLQAQQIANANLRGRPLTTIPVPPGAAAAADAAARAFAPPNVENSVTVNVQGNASANDAARIADAAGEAQRKANRRTRAALTQRASD